MIFRGDFSGDFSWFPQTSLIDPEEHPSDVCWSIISENPWESAIASSKMWRSYIMAFPISKIFQLYSCKLGMNYFCCEKHLGNL